MVMCIGDKIVVRIFNNTISIAKKHIDSRILQYAKENNCNYEIMQTFKWIEPDYIFSGDNNDLYKFLYELTRFYLIILM